MTKLDYIYNELKTDIINEVYKESELLLSESEICKKYAVSREPVRRAIAQLKHKGYITPQKGKGHVINPKEFYLYQNIFSISEEYHNLKHVLVLGFSTTYNSELFKDDQKLFEYSRVIHTDDNIILEKGFLPCELFPEFSEEICSDSILSYLKQKFAIHHVRKTFKSCLIDKYNPINNHTNNPVQHSIEVKQEVFNSDGELIQVSFQIKQNSEFVYIST